jgi:outer membrane immunogenic protein
MTDSMNRMNFRIGFMLLMMAPATFAADLSIKAPAYKAAAAVPFSWTGCSVGGHIGGVVSQGRATSPFGGSTDFSSSGFVAGGQIGCDYQFRSGWVVGAEGQAAWSSLRNSRAATVTSFVTGVSLPSQATLRNDFLASATARVGYAVNDHLLVYVRGGGAWTEEKADDAFTTAAEVIAAPGAVPGAVGGRAGGPGVRGGTGSVTTIAGIAVDPASTRTRAGWTVGTGVDWAFAPHWSANIQYNYYDFGDNGVVLSDLASNTTVTLAGLKDTIHAVTTGVDYHF